MVNSEGEGEGEGGRTKGKKRWKIVFGLFVPILARLVIILDVTRGERRIFSILSAHSFFLS